MPLRSPTTGGGSGAALVLLIGKENASPWKETAKLRVAVKCCFVAGGSFRGGEGRRLSTESDLVFGAGVELRETRGEGHLLGVENEVDDDDEDEIEEEDDDVAGESKYLEETVFNFALLELELGAPLASLSEGRSGVRLGFGFESR